ncbi:helix-turn-helix domain-containing protein [Streptomyces sp. NBC_01262]|uniref:helix-turn-helix domain-containing protein n=1 Tax=Streptomyces sp. NBC_01262 TaxID=2903803 RepID=UPI002E33BBD0|nr:helix-turn-helix transcriptional regulator [Streptomyces sp. NBC_01262]
MTSLQEPAEPGTDTGAEGPAASGVLRVFGRQVKRLRERAGLSRAELGERTQYAPSTIASYEQGRRIAPPEFVCKADDVLGAGGVLEAAIEELGRQRYPARFQDFAEMEREAVTIYSYACQLIPGLLQTEGYARALISGHCPPLDDETIDQRVAARIERQELLTMRQTTVFGFVVEEAVLRRPVGGEKVMAAQLRRLLEAGRLRNVSIQVMPMRQWSHMGLLGSMTLLESAERRTMAYTETQGVSTVITDRNEVSIFAQRHSIIRAQALGAEDSASLIEQAARDL